MGIFIPQNRGEMRRLIGMSLGICIDGAATSNGTATTLIDTKNLLGADDQHNGKEVMIYDATGSIADGSISVVSDFASSTNTATVNAAFDGSDITTAADKFEMWKTPWRIADINKAIDLAMIDAAKYAVVSKVTNSSFTESAKYQYAWLSGFKVLNKVEYAYNVGTKYTIHNCDAAWAELADPTGVTSSLDTTFKKEGGGSLKLVIAAGASTGLLKTASITSLDLSGCTEVAIWIFCTVALAAGDMQLILSASASCAALTEALDIPATVANTWTRHVISLANPQSDSAIISVGLKMITDKTCSLWADDIIAQDANTIDYRELAPEYWTIAQGTSPLLNFSYNGLSVIGENKQVRLTGYGLPDELTDDTTDAKVDPGYLIKYATAWLLVNHAYSSSLSIEDRHKMADRYMLAAERMRPSMTTSMPYGREIHA